jgi:hypothetical protein
MRIQTETHVYEVPVEVETGGPAAIRAWVVVHLPPADAARALGEPIPEGVPSAPVADDEG